MAPPLNIKATRVFFAWFLTCLSAGAIGQLPKKFDPSIQKYKHAAILPHGQKINSSFRNTRVADATCSNSTFYLHIPASPGEKIELAKLQTFSDGNFLAAGTITSTGGQKAGLLLLLA